MKNLKSKPRPATSQDGVKKNLIIMKISFLNQAYI